MFKMGSNTVLLVETELQQAKFAGDASGFLVATKLQVENRKKALHCTWLCNGASLTQKTNPHGDPFGEAPWGLEIGSPEGWRPSAFYGRRPGFFKEA